MLESEQPKDQPKAVQDLIDALNLKTVGAELIIIPQVAAIDWAGVAADLNRPIVFTNRPSQAHQLCLQGQPAIAIMGASRDTVEKWLRKRGANVIERKSMQ